MRAHGFNLPGAGSYVVIGALLALGCGDIFDPEQACRDQGGIWIESVCWVPAESSQLSDAHGSPNPATFVELPDHRFLVVGDGRAASVQCRLIDPTTGRTDLAASMHFARAFASGIALPGGEVLITGGYGSDGRVRSDAEIYDPATDTWRQVDSQMGVGRAGHTSLLLEGRIIQIVGGTIEETEYDYFLVDELGFFSR